MAIISWALITPEEFGAFGRVCKPEAHLPGEINLLALTQGRF